jgi:hypothetical protein
MVTTPFYLAPWPKPVGHFFIHSKSGVAAATGGIEGEYRGASIASQWGSQRNFEFLGTALKNGIVEPGAYGS